MILLLSAALAGNPNRWDSIPDPTAESICGTKAPVDDYVAVVGFGRGAPAKALDEAHARAVARIKEMSGYTGIRLAALSRKIRDWSPDKWERKAGGVTCARYLIARADLESLEQDAARLENNLSTVAMLIQSKGKQLQVSAPRWKSGCVALIAESVNEKLLGQLEGAIDGKDAEGRATVTLTFTATKDEVTVTPTLDGASVGGGFSFPLDLFRIAEDEVGECATNELLGLDSTGAPKGATLDLLAHEATACDGDPDTLIATAATPVRVQIFSVGKRGTGQFLGTFNVRDRQELGSGTWISMAEGGDERLLAVSVGPDQSFGKTEAWTDYCQLPTAWSRAWFPSGAAVTSETFRVFAPGEADPTGVARCKALHGDALAKRDEAAKQRDSAPTCAAF